MSIFVDLQVDGDAQNDATTDLQREREGTSGKTEGTSTKREGTVWGELDAIMAAG